MTRSPMRSRLIQFVVAAGAIVLFAGPALGQSHWETKASNSSSSLNALTYAKGLFVAVGGNGEIVTSPGGGVWTGRVTGTTDRLRAIAFGDGRFVVTKENRTAPLLTSADGINWSPATITGANGAPAESGAWQSIAFAAGRFIAVGPGPSDYSTEVLLSDDGLSFKAVMAAKYPAPDGLTASITKLIVFRDQIYGVEGAVTTVDGAIWKARPSMRVGYVFASDNVSKIAILREGFHSGSFSVDGGSAYYVSDTFNYRYTQGVPRAACYGAGRFIAVDSKGGTWSSERGEYWTPGKVLAQSGEEFRSVAFDGTSRFVAVGSAPAGGSALVAAMTADPL